MKGNPVSRMLAEIVKNPADAKAFLQDPDKYLADRNLKLHEQELWILRGFAEKLARPQPSAAKSTCGHADSNTHTDYNASDGHYNWSSHLNHTNCQ
jgi:hypothetical protein